MATITISYYYCFKHDKKGIVPSQNRNLCKHKTLMGKWMTKGQPCIKKPKKNALFLNFQKKKWPTNTVHNKVRLIHYLPLITGKSGQRKVISGGINSQSRFSKKKSCLQSFYNKFVCSLLFGCLKCNPLLPRFFLDEFALRTTTIALLRRDTSVLRPISMKHSLPL